LVSLPRIKQHTISNDLLRVSAINFGARTVQVLLNTRAGGWIPVILALPTAEAYLDDQHYMGATVGRVAGRVSNSQYSHQGQWVQLQPNEGQHHLHGGVSGFAQSFWDSTSKQDSIQFNLFSQNGDNGYPGNLEVTNTIRVSGCDLVYRTEAVCDKDTPFNSTQHNYYNLGGSATIKAHSLSINADRVLELGPQQLPTGRTIDVKGTEFDFRKARQLGMMQPEHESQIKAFGGLDHYFVRSNWPGGKSEDQPPIAELSTSDYRMQVFTNQPGVQVYTGNGLNPAHQGVCIEAQHFPDSPNHRQFPSVFLKPGDVGLNETRYRFLEID
jgi:aldose 1-epimerase